MIDKNILKDIVAHNENQMEKAGYDQTYAEDLYVVDKYGQDVYDFFMDETFRESVDPVEYYGKEELLKVIKKWKSR